MPDRTVQESSEISAFLNYVNHADIRYGGGNVSVDGLPANYAHHTIEARPTVTFNKISNSGRHLRRSDSPGSEFYGEVDGNLYTADYTRGP